MLKKFNPHEDVSSQSNMKSSGVRQLRSQLLKWYPALDQASIDLLIPPPSKRISVLVCKCNMLNVSLICLKYDSYEDDSPTQEFEEQEFLLWNHFDGPWMPTLRVLHRMPWMLPVAAIDKGATKHIATGSPVMCPGLTNDHAVMPDGVKVGDAVAIVGEGKQSACAIGQWLMTPDEIRRVNKDVGINTMHHIGDALWQNAVFK